MVLAPVLDQSVHDWRWDQYNICCISTSASFSLEHSFKQLVSSLPTCWCLLQLFPSSSHIIHISLIIFCMCFHIFLIFHLPCGFQWRDDHLHLAILCLAPILRLVVYGSVLLIFHFAITEIFHFSCSACLFYCWSLQSLWPTIQGWLCLSTDLKLQYWQLCIPC